MMRKVLCFFLGMVLVLGGMDNSFIPLQKAKAQMKADKSSNSAVLLYTGEKRTIGHTRIGQELLDYEIASCQMDREKCQLSIPGIGSKTGGNITCRADVTGSFTLRLFYRFQWSSGEYGILQQNIYVTVQRDVEKPKLTSFRTKSAGGKNTHRFYCTDNDRIKKVWVDGKKVSFKKVQKIDTQLRPVFYYAITIRKKGKHRISLQDRSGNKAAYGVNIN